MKTLFINMISEALMGVKKNCSIFEIILYVDTNVSEELVASFFRRKSKWRESKYTQILLEKAFQKWFFKIIDSGDQDGSRENNFRGFKMDDSNSLRCPMVDFCFNGFDLLYTAYCCHSS